MNIDIMEEMTESLNERSFCKCWVGADRCEKCKFTGVTISHATKDFLEALEKAQELYKLGPEYCEHSDD